MRIVSRKSLVQFWEIHKEVETPLLQWFRVVSEARWQNSNDVKQTFNTVDQPIINQKRIAILNVGGNKFRIIASIHFNTQIVFIRDILTHTQYERGSWRNKI